MDAPLGRRVRSGLLWGMFNTGLGRAGTTVMGIVLARLLDPQEFGVFAVALVVYNGLLSINELGVSLAIIRWKDSAVEAIDGTVTTIAIAASCVMYAICFVAAPLLASALGAPSATGVIRVLCLGVVVDGIVAVPGAWLQREFRQQRQTLIDQANFAVGAAVTILLAVNGSGAWSLAWGRLAGNLVAIVLTIKLCPRRFHLGFNRSLVPSIVRFGAPLAAASALVFAVLNADYIIIGVMLGPVSLGFYVLAFNLSSWPVNMLSATVRRVSFAGFARMQDDPAEMSAAFVRALGLLATVAIPVCALLVGLAAPAIHVVYGTKWSESAPILAFLAILGACRVGFELSYDYLAAAGRSNSCLAVQAVWLMSLIPALALAAALDGGRGVAGGHVVVALAVVVPAFGFALHRAGIQVRAAAGVLVRPALGGVVAAGVVYAVAQAVTNVWAALVAGAAAGLVAYLPFVWPTVRIAMRAVPRGGQTAEVRAA
jgi:PST family polysaccharide transporter